MGTSFLSRSRSMVSLSSRRSSLVPTRRMGVWGQWCRTSGYHCGDGGSDPSPQRLLPEPALEQAGLPTVTGSTPGPSCFRVTARFGVGQEHPAGKLQGLSGPPSQGPCSPPPTPPALADPTPSRTGTASACKGQFAWVRSSTQRPRSGPVPWAPPALRQMSPGLPYLGSNILKGGWAHQGEADQEHILGRGHRRERSRGPPCPANPRTSGTPQPAQDHLRSEGRRAAAAGRSPPARQCPTAPG